MSQACQDLEESLGLTLRGVFRIIQVGADTIKGSARQRLHMDGGCKFPGQALTVVQWNKPDWKLEPFCQFPRGRIIG